MDSSKDRGILIIANTSLLNQNRDLFTGLGPTRCEDIFEILGPLKTMHWHTRVYIGVYVQSGNVVFMKYQFSDFPMHKCLVGNIHSHLNGGGSVFSML